MTFPEVQAFINFDVAPDVAASFHLDDAVLGVLDTSTLADTDVWSDVSGYLKGAISIIRGSRRVDTPVLRYEAGTASVTLNNADRRFDPTNLGASIGLIVADSLSPTSGDAALSSHFDTLGYQMAYIDDNDAAPTSGYDLFIIAGSALSGAVAAKYDTVAVPCVVFKELVWDDMRLSTSAGTFSASSAVYTLLAHAITTGLSSPLTFTTAAASQSKVANADLPAGASAFARCGVDATATTGWAVETGGTLTSGTAPARRVALGITDGFAATLTADGFTLVEQAVSWALDGMDARAPYVAAGVTQVEPMRKLWLRVNWAGTVYDLFQGFIDAWNISYFEPDWSEVTVPATDAFTVLGEYDRIAVAAVGTGEDSGDRVNRILDSVSWPAADRLIDTGDSTLQSTTLDGDGLTELFLVADSELGELYVDGTGQVVFRHRLAMLEDARSNTSQATFGDGGGSELPYADLGISNDRSTVANLAQVSRTGGTTQTVEDAESRLLYRTHTFNRTDLLLQTDTEVADYAGWIIGQSATPELRFDTITIKPHRDETALFPQVLGRRFGDRITVVRRPPGGGSSISRDVIIRGVTHEITTRLEWRTVWTLQSATKYAYLVLDSATLGILDTDRLAF